MLDLANVDSFIKSIESGPNASTIDVSVLPSSRVAHETRYLARMGVIGILPFANYYLNGDLLALRAEVGKSIDNWSVVSVSHIGDGCQTLCSRLSRLMPALMLRDTPLPHQQALKVFSPSILKYATWMSDNQGLTQALIDQLRDETGDMFDPLPLVAFSYADPDSILAYFESEFDRLMSDDTSDSIAGWQKICQVDPTYAPAQAMLFKAVLATDDDEAIRQTAWDVVMLNHALDNVYMVIKVRDEKMGWSNDNPIIVAAKTLLERGLPPVDKALIELMTPAITAIANDEDAYDGTEHLQMAKQLHAQKQIELAYTACQNAIYWRNISQEAVYPEALAFALTIARDWKQADLIRVLELAQELEPTATQDKTSLPPEIVIPRDVELSSTVIANIQKLSTSDVARLWGDTLLIYRYNRWHYFTMSYLGQTKHIATMAILNMHKLPNTLDNVAEEEIVPLSKLPSLIQQELRFKLLPEISDYQYLMDRKFMSIVGGATSEDISSPQLTLEKEHQLTRNILTEGGGGWFNFWRTWDEIEIAFNERG